MKFEWTTEAQNVYEKFKLALTRTPVLVIPKDEKRFSLYTDASVAVGLGVMLAQIGMATICASRTLNSSEINNAIVKWVGLAGIWARENFGL